MSPHHLLFKDFLKQAQQLQKKIHFLFIMQISFLGNEQCSLSKPLSYNYTIHAQKGTSGEPQYILPLVIWVSGQNPYITCSLRWGDQFN